MAARWARLLESFPFGVVQERPSHADGATSLVPRDCTAAMEITHLTSGTKNAALQIVGLIQIQGRVDGGQDPLTILRVQGIEEGVYVAGMVYGS